MISLDRIHTLHTRLYRKVETIDKDMYLTGWEISDHYLDLTRVAPPSHRVDVGTRASRNAAATIRSCGTGVIRVDFDHDRRG